MRLRLIPQKTSIDFMRIQVFTFIITAIMTLGAIYYITVQGFNYGIDFSGGTLIEARTTSKPDLANIREQLSRLGLGAVSLQELGVDNDLLIRIQQQPEGEAAQKVVMDKITGVLGEGTEYRRVEFVGPQVGSELKKAGLEAFLLSVGGILVYVWFRFEWQFGVAAIAALLHDTIVTVGLFSFSKMEFDLTTIAAILTIAGYSTNDTVVVFDRIRENLRRYKKIPLEEVFNISINDTLSRTFMTGFTTLLALFALWIYGGEVIRGFTFALIWGIVIGTYSSVFVATSLLLYLGLDKKRQAVPTGKSVAAAGS